MSKLFEYDFFIQQNKHASLPYNGLSVHSCGGSLIQGHHSTSAYHNHHVISHDQQNSTASSSDSDSECQNSTGSQDNNANASHQNRYKTELCRNFSVTGSCNYGKKCQYAHGKAELNLKPERKTNQYYKTRPCKEFYKTLFCPYGQRCKYSHSQVQPTEATTTRISPTFYQRKLIAVESESVTIPRLPFFAQSFTTNEKEQQTPLARQ